MLSSPRAGSWHPHLPFHPTLYPAHPFTHLWDGTRDSCQVPLEAEDVGTEVVTDAGCGAAGSSCFPQRQACCEQEEPPGQPHGTSGQGKMTALPTGPGCHGGHCCDVRAQISLCLALAP